MKKILLIIYMCFLNILYAYPLIIVYIDTFYQYDENKYKIESIENELIELLNSFLQNPTNLDSNKELYYNLERLEDKIKSTSVDKSYQVILNNIGKDIKTIKEFLAPISDKYYNASLTEHDLKRLKEIFGGNFLITYLSDVKKPIDEIEVIEITVGSLKMCYFHNIAKKSKIGIKVKYYAMSWKKNVKHESYGDMGIFKNEYGHMMNNVTSKYPKLRYAKIIEYN